MRTTVRHAIRYINWSKEAKYEVVDHKRWNDMYLYLSDFGQVCQDKTRRSSWEEGSYNIDKSSPNRWKMYFYMDGEYHVYCSNSYDDTKNGEDHGAGRMAFKAVTDMLTEREETSMRKAFGYTESEFKTCVPKQFYYINESHIGKVMHHVSSVDYCSHYPTNICGRLPDAHTSVEYEGTVKPNEEYPFAFYVRSGHLAEYGVFDTHDWLRSEFMTSMFRFKVHDSDRNCFNESVTPDEDKTVLMKASPYTLDDIMDHFYNKRKTDENAKRVMNAFIGYLHTNDYRSNKLAHVAAIAIGRANEKMRHLAEDIVGKRWIEHLCVDGLIYRGIDEYGVSEKKLGNLNQEFTDCDFMMRSMNCYAASKDGKVVKYKHGSYNKNEDGSDITDDTVTDLECVWHWINTTEDLQG